MALPKVGYRGDPKVMKYFQTKVGRYNKGKPREKHIKAADILEPFMRRWKPPKK